MTNLRAAIAKVVEPFVEQAMGDYGSGSYDEDGMLDAILALPEMVALLEDAEIGRQVRRAVANQAALNASEGQQQP